MLAFRKSLATLLVGLSLIGSADATMITVENADGAGEGLNDPTVVAPIGGNAGVTRGEQRLIAIEYAAGIWESIVESAVEIRLEARFDPLACDAVSAELGFGGPDHLFTVTSPNAVADTWYPAALGDRLQGADGNFLAPDITATFTSRLEGTCTFPFDFYYGLDGAGDPNSTIDFPTIALREIAHGLGFWTATDVTTGALFASKNDIFIKFLEDHSTGKTWDVMTDGERLTSASDTGDLLWVGDRVTDSIGLLSGGTASGRVIMHAPATIAQGETAIHWDPSITPNQLVEPVFGGAIHDPGMSRALLADIGWLLSTCGNASDDIGEICDGEECCSATCGYATAGTSCDDGTFCNGTETCDGAGACTGASSGDPCPGADGDDDCSEQCDEATDSCSLNDPDASPCNDLDICTPIAQCASGVCIGSGDVCQLDPYLAYAGRPAKKDGLGTPLANKLPKPWAIQLNDFHIADSDIDDPENFEVKNTKALLNPAFLNDGSTMERPNLRYLRYQLKLNKEGVGTEVNGKFPKAEKHVERLWELDNAFGTINVITRKANAFLLPAATDPNGPPADPNDTTHFVCYQLKLTKDITDQTPDTGRGVGKFRKDLQAFFEDEFDDCAQNKDGGTSFAGTPVEGRCLFDFKKPREFCSPVTKSPVGLGRETLADFSGTTAAATNQGLLCYQGKPSSKVLNSDAATLLGAQVGDKIDPKQSKHLRRRVKDGNPVFTAPGNGFDAPEIFDTSKVDRICLPTTVNNVVVAPD